MADVTDATFQTAVIERSMSVPVVVDLWAEWCGPCKQLGPMLERIIAATNGAVELAKVDVDANPQVAQAFRVQSIPAVYAFVDGRPVDQFLGLQPEAEIEAFVARLMPEPVRTEVDLLIEQGDEESLRRALELEPDSVEATISLAELLAGEERGDEALALLAKIPESADTRRIAALVRTGVVTGEEIITELGELLGKVRGDDDARARFVDLLELLDDEDPAKADWRRKLSAELF